MMYIYGLQEPVSGYLRYVGATNNIEKRFQSHLKDTRKSPKNCWVQSLLRKGWLPEIFIIEEISDNDWRDAEKFWINYFRYLGSNLLNLASGGSGGNTGVHPQKGKTYEEFYGFEKAAILRKRQSLSRQGEEAPHFGHRHSEATLEKMRLAQKGHPNPNKGKTHEEIYGLEKSKLLKDNQRKKKLGKKHSFETIEKIKNTIAANPRKPNRHLLGRHRVHRDDGTFFYPRIT